VVMEGVCMCRGVLSERQWCLEVAGGRNSGTGAKAGDIPAMLQVAACHGRCAVKGSVVHRARGA